MQHIEGRPEKTLVFFSKMKLQRAVRDNQSSKYTSVKLLLILPHPTNLDAKGTVKRQQLANEHSKPITWGIVPGLRTHSSLGLGSKGPYLLS